MKSKVFFQLVDTLAMGGTERMSVNMAAAMHEKGWESHLIVSRKGGGMEAHLADGVQVHYLNKKSFADLIAFFRLVALQAKYRPTVFHAHSTSIYWAVLLKLLAGRFLLVWHDHFGLSDQLEQYPRKDMVILSKWIDRIVTVNDKLLQYWQSLLPYRKSTIQKIGNFPFLNLAPEARFPRFTFLHLANFRPQKDQLNLIRAASLLHQKGLDFEILMVGEFVEEAWVEKVKAEVEHLGLGKNITILGPSSEVSRLLAKCHAGVLSSESEGLPVALLEYGLAALPVVCTEVGDCAKVISDPSMGLLVPSGDPKTLADALEKLVSSPSEELQIMGELLRKKVETEYGKEAFLSSYLNLLSAK